MLKKKKRPYLNLLLEIITGTLLALQCKMFPFWGDGQFETWFFLSLFSPLWCFFFSKFNSHKNLPPGITGALSLYITLSVISSCPNILEQQWFFVLFMPSLFYCKALLKLFNSSKKTFIILQIFYLSITLMAPFRFYFSSQADFYFPFVGFWHGPIYDDLLTVHYGILFYSFISYVFSFLIANHKHSVIFLCLYLFLSIYFNPYPTKTLIKLPNNIEINLSDSLKQSDINKSGLGLTILSLSYKFQIYLDRIYPKKITFNLSKNPLDKKIHFGIAETQMTKPWKGEIFLDLYSLNLSLLIHEISHIYGGFVSSGLWGAPGGIIPNPLFLEGFADSISDRNNPNFSLSVWSRISNFGLDAKKLSNPYYFWTAPAKLSYQLSSVYFQKEIQNGGCKNAFEIFKIGKTNKDTWKKLMEVSTEYKLLNKEKVKIERLKKHKGYGKRTCIHNFKLARVHRPIMNPHKRKIPLKLSSQELYLYGNPYRSIFWWHKDLNNSKKLRLYTRTKPHE